VSGSGGVAEQGIRLVRLSECSGGARRAQLRRGILPRLPIKRVEQRQCRIRMAEPSLEQRQLERRIARGRTPGGGLKRCERLVVAAFVHGNVRQNSYGSGIFCGTASCKG
jgi:hypothetical protein